METNTKSGSKLVEVLTSDVLSSILDEHSPVEEVVMNLFRRGTDLADAVTTRNYESWEEFKTAHAAGDSAIVELEGLSEIDDSDVVVLRGCPMADEMKKLSVNGSPPEFHTRIITDYMHQNPGSNAILHPGCIAHQVSRQLIVKNITIAGEHCLNYYQLACRSGATGKVVYDENGLNAIGMSKEQANQLIDGFACLYVIFKS